LTTTTKIKFEELGSAYRHQFYEQAHYLIDRGYVEGDYRVVAAKIYDSYIDRKMKEHENSKSSTDNGPALREPERQQSTASEPDEVL
jgi:hypothetical protein